MLDKLRELADGSRAIVERPLQKALDLVQETAVRGIAEGPKTGRVYTQRFAVNKHGYIFAYGSRPPHQASAPGEYPASDTGTLMGSIWNEILDGLAGLPN
ncbi:MAG TPA: hypothetical protein PKY87_15400, partial [Terricaulis sp.]|nr:hypothetical protein [Terricaulis sp.]